MKLLIGCALLLTVQLTLPEDTQQAIRDELHINACETGNGRYLEIRRVTKLGTKEQNTLEVYLPWGSLKTTGDESYNSRP